MLTRSCRLAARGAIALAVLVAGCGGQTEEGTPAISSSGPPGEGGTLVWAVADRVVSADPLEAASRAEEIATRQVNEPLTAKVSPPFDPERRVPGLVRSARSSDGDTVWTFELRTGVRFQDNSPFNAAAVRANGVRWLTTAAGNAALPGLVAVDSPRPNEVRFALSSPDPGFKKRLASPRLGIVSPDALQPNTGEGAVLSRSSQTGTGPFEIRQRSPALTLLARNTDWWGTFANVDLGPALDQIELRSDPSPGIRLAMLDAGEAQLADELGRVEAAQAMNDPLLSVLTGSEGSFLGVERSVRGVTSAREIPALSGAWLTGVNVAD